MWFIKQGTVVPPVSSCFRLKHPAFVYQIVTQEAVLLPQQYSVTEQFWSLHGVFPGMSLTSTAPQREPKLSGTGERRSPSRPPLPSAVTRGAVRAHHGRARTAT